MENTKVHIGKSIITFTCPNCGQHKLFTHSNAYSLKHKNEMHKKCPNCNYNFLPEPGFYFGAAYLSYGISVLFGSLAWLLLWLMGIDRVEIILGTIISLILGLSPLTYRLSRSLWIGIHVAVSKND